MSSEDAQLQPGRREFIGSLIRKGYFEKVDLSAEPPQVWITPAFWLIDSEQQEAYLSVVYDYYATAEGRPLPVSVRDTVSGNEIGSYDRAAGGLHLD